MVGGIGGVQLPTNLTPWQRACYADSNPECKFSGRPNHKWLSWFSEGMPSAYWLY
jgi:hypothetical protein